MCAVVSGRDSGFNACAYNKMDRKSKNKARESRLRPLLLVYVVIAVEPDYIPT